MAVTASELYAFVKCPHRIWRDAHDDPSLKDPPNEFVKMLWDSGTQHEQKILSEKFSAQDVLDLSQIPTEEKVEKTLEAMNNGRPWIYQGRLEIDDLVGSPDLLALQPNGEYWPVDIKSGMGVSAEDEYDEGKYKKSYAVQIGLYIDALMKLGYLSEHKGGIIDSSGSYVEYDLDQPQSKRNTKIWWELYLEVLDYVRCIISKETETEPALSSICKLCEWYSDCKKQCVNNKCLSLVPELGRSKKEALAPLACNIDELSCVRVEDHLDSKGKTGIPGIGEKTLRRMQMRAALLMSGSKDPILTGSFSFPKKPIELFFDIEADPTQDIIYLHGVVERRPFESSKEVFHAFVAHDVSAEEEKRAWKEFWDYIRAFPKDDYAVYYYSKYERTQYRVLARKYPDVCGSEEVEVFFDPERSIDLYFDIVKKYTEWPTYNYSVKTLAQHLGFEWRDKNPSGAASIQWFNEWCKSKEQGKLQRILDYNEDDCIAMIRIKDGLDKYLKEVR